MKNQLIIILISYSSHILSVQDTRLVELKDTLPSQQSSDTLQAQSEKNEEQSFADRKYYIKSIMEERGVSREVAEAFYDFFSWWNNSLASHLSFYIISLVLKQKLKLRIYMRNKVSVSIFFLTYFISTFQIIGMCYLPQAKMPIAPKIHKIALLPQANYSQSAQNILLKIIWAIYLTIL